jgi:hypothetical protein
MDGIYYRAMVISTYSAEYVYHIILKEKKMALERNHLWTFYIIAWIVNNTWTLSMENIFKYSNICTFSYIVSNKSCFMNTQTNKNVKNELHIS